MALSVDAVDIKKRIESCKNLQEVEGIRLEYLGKKGLIPSEMKLLGKLSIDERKLKGQELNKLKSLIEDAIDNFNLSKVDHAIKRNLGFFYNFVIYINFVSLIGDCI